MNSRTWSPAQLRSRGRIGRQKENNADTKIFQLCWREINRTSSKFDSRHSSVGLEVNCSEKSELSEIGDSCTHMNGGCQLSKLPSLRALLPMPPGPSSSAS
jgi:hypothetical protein